ncbi:hypothetical protein CALCODRAFT_553096 [Calocera cornea HHB12733]|uniref:Uncharacterized protein n=1 Tax=Calocera cornea HHB12733 TaxID=1353952 RepID=A0A165JAZ2_9BASI|nr:hypothetical protein CALCODRAFT_553096 [Calocera cornea HHB12733]
MDILPDSDEERTNAALGFSDDEGMDLFPPPLAPLGVTHDSISDFVTPLVLPSVPAPFAFPTDSNISEFTPSAADVPLERRSRELDTSLSSIQLTGVGPSSDTSRQRQADAPVHPEPPKKKGPPKPRRLPPIPRSGTSVSTASTAASTSSIPLMVPTIPPSEPSRSTRDDHVSSSNNSPAILPKPVQFFETQSSDRPPHSKSAFNHTPAAEHEEYHPILLHPSDHKSKGPSPPEMHGTSDVRDTAKEEAARRKRNLTYTSSAESIHGHLPPIPTRKVSREALSTRIEPIVLSSDPVDDRLPVPTAAERVKMTKRKSTDASSGGRQRSRTHIDEEEDGSEYEDAPAAKRKPKARIQDSESEPEMESKKTAPKKSKKRNDELGSEFEPEAKKSARKRGASAITIDSDEDEDADTYEPSKRRKSAPANLPKPGKQKHRMAMVEVVIPLMKPNGPHKTRTTEEVSLARSRDASRAVLTSEESDEDDSHPISHHPSPAPATKRRKSEPAPKKAKPATARKDNFKSAEFIASDEEDGPQSISRPPSPAPPAKRRKSEPAPKKPTAANTRKDSTKSKGFVVSDDDSPSGDEAAAPVPVPMPEPKEAAKQRARTEPSKAVTPPSTPARPKETPSQKRKRERARMRALKEQEEREKEKEQEVEVVEMVEIPAPAPKKEKHKQPEKEKPAPKPAVPAPAPARTTTSAIAKENVPPPSKPPAKIPPITSVTPKALVKMEGSLAHSIPNKPLTLSTGRRIRFGLSKSLGGKIAPLHPKRKTPPPRAPPAPSKKKKVESDAEDEEEEEVVDKKRKVEEEDGDWEEGRAEVLVED